MLDVGEMPEGAALVAQHLCNKLVPLPRLLQIEITARCNLHCVMCKREVRHINKGESAVDLPVSVLERLSDVLRLADDVSLFGFGEPLLHPQLVEWIAGCKSYGCRVHVATNGTLLSQDLAERLALSRLDYLAVSLDAASQETYRSIRQNPHFLAAVDGIRAMAQIKTALSMDNPFVMLTFTLMRSNIAELPDFVRLAHNLDVKTIALNSLNDYGAGSNLHLDEMATETREAYQDGVALAQALNISLVGVSHERVWQEMAGQSARPWPAEPTAGTVKNCAVPWLVSFVRANGDVLPCCNTAESHVMGNIHRESLRDIWYGDAYQAFRRRMLSSDPPEGCCNCRLPEPPWRQLDFAAWVDLGQVPLIGPNWLGVDNQMLGWHAPEPDGSRPQLPRRLMGDAGPKRNAPQSFRWTHRQATLFLRSPGPGVLRIDVASLSLRSASGQVLVNDREVGRFRVRGRGSLSYQIHEPAGRLLAVKIVVDQAQPVAELDFTWKVIAALPAGLAGVMQGRGLRRPFAAAYHSLCQDTRVVGIKVYKAHIEPRTGEEARAGSLNQRACSSEDRS